MIISRLPLGKSDFTQLRLNNQVYVDKTATLMELFGLGFDRVFFARPRRFGKSLLLSTLASLFRDGLKHFHGLAAEKAWQDKTYCVIELDFSVTTPVKNADEFRVHFHSMLRQAFSSLGFSAPIDAPDFLQQWHGWLASQRFSPLVLLIDEYDAPLTHALHNKALFEDIQDVLSRFFHVVKANDKIWRFLFITGITRFSHTGIFSGLNNLIDITLDPRFSTLVGYTEAELRRYFGDHLQLAANAHHMDVEHLIVLLKTYYDGFSFDVTAHTHVFAPWSILNFFASFDFRFNNYWFQSGGQPTVLMNYLLERKLQDPLDFLQPIKVAQNALLSSQPYHNLDINTLLHQTGYLTIRAVDTDGRLVLGFPNREVESSMANLYRLMMTKDSEDEPLPSLLTLLNQGDAAPVVEYLNTVFNSLNYTRYPIRDEASFQGALQILLIGLELHPQIEVHTAHGRSDIEVQTPDYHWIFELKWVEQQTQAQSACKKAVAQMEQKQYGCSQHGKKRIRLALVFASDLRQIATWHCVDKSPQHGEQR